MEKIDLEDDTFKAQFMEYCNEKGNKLNNSFTITKAKRERIIQCLKNPQSEASSKFRFWVRQKKFRLIQTEDSDEDIVGIPVDGKDGDEVRLYGCTDACMCLKLLVLCCFLRVHSG